MSNSNSQFIGETKVTNNSGRVRAVATQLRTEKVKNITVGLTFTSNQEGVTMPRFILMPKTTEKWSSHRKSWFARHWMSISEETDSWEMGRKWSEPHNCPVSALRGFPGHGTGRGIQAEYRVLPQLKRWCRRVQGGQDIENFQDRVPGRKKLHRERTPEICRGQVPVQSLPK